VLAGFCTSSRQRAPSPSTTRCAQQAVVRQQQHLGHISHSLFVTVPYDASRITLPCTYSRWLQSMHTCNVAVRADTHDEKACSSSLQPHDKGAVNINSPSPAMVASGVVCHACHIVIQLAVLDAPTRRRRQSARLRRGLAAANMPDTLFLYLCRLTSTTYPWWFGCRSATPCSHPSCTCAPQPT
jgi:hypothetical protein